MGEKPALEHVAGTDTHVPQWWFGLGKTRYGSGIRISKKWTKLFLEAKVQLHYCFWSSSQRTLEESTRCKIVVAQNGLTSSVRTSKVETIELSNQICDMTSFRL